MTQEDCKTKEYFCFHCANYDEVLGCTMPFMEKTYACPLEDNPDLPEQEFIEEA